MDAGDMSSERATPDEKPGPVENLDGMDAGDMSSEQATSSADGVPEPGEEPAPVEKVVSTGHWNLIDTRLSKRHPVTVSPMATR